MNKKAVSLLSGGLDRVLATKLIVEQGVDVTALHFTSPFFNCTHGKNKGCGIQAVRSAQELGVKVVVKAKGMEYLKILQAPRHGYGKNMNPCIDCRIFILRKAAEFMKEIDASFIITGEVLGQRPMSQRRDAMDLIDRETGLEGIIVRPLSAQHFPPTVPEQEGIIDRQKLLNFVGRSRKRQYELADEYDIKEFSCPGGGCLLTDSMFAGRIRDLFKHTPDYTMHDATLLKTGRHFRLSEKTKVIIGRDEEENKKLENLSFGGNFLLNPVSFKGPTALIAGDKNNSIIDISANIMAMHAKGVVFPVTVETAGDEPIKYTVNQISLDLEKMRI
jgi:tRNA-uridine 2-sulfurtransferase